MDAPERHIFLFVVWSGSRAFEARIRVDLAARFRILKELEVTWPRRHFTANLAAFYGWRAWLNWWRKGWRCGRGPFRAIVVEDATPDFAWTRDTSGHVLLADRRIVAAKRQYRQWTGHSNRIHASVTQTETRHQLRALLGCDLAAFLARPDLDGGVEAVSAARRLAFAPMDAVPAAVAALVPDARVLLRGKYLNDVFWTGTCQGTPCIVKRSRKAVWSIGNEYRMNRRLHAAAPGVAPRPLAWRRAADGRSAFVVTARVAGPSLTDLLARGVTDAQADGFAADILALAGALRRTHILHRDLFTDNLLLDADGHLKAIDWQLAIDRRRYREDPWVRRHWKFRYVVFGVNRELGLGVWNDFHALGKILARLPQTAAVRAARAALAADEAGMAFAAPPRGWTLLRLRLYALSLRLQMWLNRRRPAKYARLARRWRTIVHREASA